jgi:hypothetical protein
VGVGLLRRIERDAHVKPSLAAWMLAVWFGVLTAGRALAYTASYLLYGKGT